jgi:hypothetical protein
VRRALAIAIAAVALAGCGSGGEGVAVVERGGSATRAYAGPLDGRAAVAALECEGRSPYRRGHGVYDDGLATVRESAEAALDDYMRESGLSFTVPPDGYAVERDQTGRVLFSYDVGGRTKVAIVAADGVRDWDHHDGWGVRAWAQCDPSEFRAVASDDLNIGVWEDGSGHRVPVTRVQSFQGAEHCNWTDITFLLVGPERTADWYVRDTGGELRALLRTTYGTVEAIPEGAADTGFRRDGRELWIGPGREAAYLVSTGDAHDIERWPAAKEPIRCA